MKGRMSYALTSPFLSERFTYPIADIEFNKLERSHQFLLRYMAFEETILQTLYAVQDFEEFILKSALQDHLFPISEYDFAQDMRLRGNIKVNAFLNAVTSIKDQFPKFTGYEEVKSVREEFKKRWKSAKDESVTFSFFERLRNHAQHATQPISTVTTGGGWDESRDLVEARMSIYVEVESVSSNRDIREDEAQSYRDAFGEKADVSLIFRETLGQIGQIVEAVRISTENVFRESCEDLSRHLETARQHQRDDISPYCNVSKIDGDQITKLFSLFPELISRAERLRHTFLMKNNERHFVSSRAYGHKKKRN